MKLLWFGDLAATGFGTVTADAGRALLELGIDVRFLSQNEIGRLPEPFRSRTVDTASLERGVRGGVVGASDVVGGLMRGTSGATLASGDPWGDWKPDAAIILGDFMAVRMFVAREPDVWGEVPTWHYVPIEGVDLPPAWADMWRVIRPIAMSRFGQMEIAKVTGQIPPLVHHGVNSDAFYPVSRERPIVIEDPTGKQDPITLTSKAACRIFFCPPDEREASLKQLWVLRTDRHMPRKRHNALLRAMQPILLRHPNVRLILHCQPHDQGGYLPDSISKLPPGIQGQVVLTRQSGIPRNVLNALYNAADLYASVSAEGFGLTIAEAIAAGVPAVGLDYSAVPEVIGPAGRTVPVSHLLDNEYDHAWAAVDEAQFGQAVEWMLTHHHRRQALGAEGPGHVSRSFRWDTAAQQFVDIVSAHLAQEVAA